MTDTAPNDAHSSARPALAPLADRFAHRPGLVYLNHGSYGATPRTVLDRQTELRNETEADAVEFFLTRLVPLLDESREVVGPMIGVPADEVLFARNATQAVAALLQHLVEKLAIGPGDSVLTNDHEYAACNSELKRLAERHGFELITAKLPYPLNDPGQASEAIVSAAKPGTRLALLSAITSPSALVMPAAEITAALQAKGVTVLIDGAHAPGQIEWDTAAIGADAFACNLHKWLCAPKSGAVLWARPELAEGLEPHALSSRTPTLAGRPDRSKRLFDYVGTDDYTPSICAGDSIRAIAGMLPGGWAEAVARNHDLAITGRDTLCERLGLSPMAPDSMVGSMSALRLPGGAPGSAEITGSGYDEPLQQQLVERFGIQVPVWSEPGGAARLLRISAFLYNTPEQYEYLADALATLLAD